MHHGIGSAQIKFIIPRTQQTLHVIDGHMTRLVIITSFLTNLSWLRVEDNLMKIRERLSNKGEMVPKRRLGELEFIREFQGRGSFVSTQLAIRVADVSRR